MRAIIAATVIVERRWRQRDDAALLPICRHYAMLMPPRCRRRFDAGEFLSAPFASAAAITMIAAHAICQRRRAAASFRARQTLMPPRRCLPRRFTPRLR